MAYLQFILHFAIIFNIMDNDDANELLCFDMKSKTKIIKRNKIWKYNVDCSYCIHETNNDYLIYRIGGYNNNKVSNIEYSLKNNNYN